MCVCCSAGVRKGTILTFMLADHLGSTSLTTDSAGNVISELRYKPWGEVRTQAGTTSTGYQFTGQYSYAADFGLLYYGARFYDPQLGRFSSPDSIIPQSQGVQAYDRYAYVSNNPLRYTDPSGHEFYEISQDTWGVLQGQIGITTSSLQEQAENFAFWSQIIVGGGLVGITACLTALNLGAPPVAVAIAIGGAVLAEVASTAAGAITYDVMGGKTASDLSAASAYLTAEANLAKALGGDTGSTNFQVLILENGDGTYTVQTVGLISDNQPVTISNEAGLQLKQIFNDGNGGVKPKIIGSELREERKSDYE